MCSFLQLFRNEEIKDVWCEFILLLSFWKTFRRGLQALFFLFNHLQTGPQRGNSRNFQEHV